MDGRDGRSGAISRVTPMHRLWDFTGWSCFGIGTAATWSSQDHITAIGLAIAGLIIVIGKASVSTYRDFTSVEIDRAKALATARHDQLVTRLQEARCPLLESGGCRASRPDNPPCEPAAGQEA